MKHMRVITKDVPASAFWWQWFGQYGELKSGGADSYAAMLVNILWGIVGSFDPRAV